MELVVEGLMAGVGVILAIEIRFLIWWLFGGSVDCILNRLIGSIFVSAAGVGRSWYMFA